MERPTTATPLRGPSATDYKIARNDAIGFGCPAIVREEQEQTIRTERSMS
jgi:hypothetical protein